MSAEDGWHSHRVAREGFPEVPREEIGRPEGPWALRQGPGARAGCKGHEVSEEQGCWPQAVGFTWAFVVRREMLGGF